ncbi:MAG: Dabb family protein [Vicinamibacterales bacterium]
MSVTHVVLFRPRPDLSAEARLALVDALARAARDIPGVIRFDVGRQLADGPAYAGATEPGWPFYALVEVEDRGALMAYLAHDAHRALGASFNASLERAVVGDFETMPATAAHRLLDDEVRPT